MRKHYLQQLMNLDVYLKRKWSKFECLFATIGQLNPNSKEKITPSIIHHGIGLHKIAVPIKIQIDQEYTATVHDDDLKVWLNAFEGLFLRKYKRKCQNEPYIRFPIVFGDNECCFCVRMILTLTTPGVQKSENDSSDNKGVCLAFFAHLRKPSLPIRRFGRLLGNKTSNGKDMGHAPCGRNAPTRRYFQSFTDDSWSSKSFLVARNNFIVKEKQQIKYNNSIRHDIQNELHNLNSKMQNRNPKPLACDLILNPIFPAAKGQLEQFNEVDVDLDIEKSDNCINLPTKNTNEMPDALLYIALSNQILSPKVLSETLQLKHWRIRPWPNSGWDVDADMFGIIPLLGYMPQNLIHLALDCLVHPKDAYQLSQWLLNNTTHHAKRDPSTENFVCRWRCANGEYAWLAMKMLDKPDLNYSRNIFKTRKQFKDTRCVSPFQPISYQLSWVNGPQNIKEFFDPVPLFPIRRRRTRSEPNKSAHTRDIKLGSRTFISSLNLSDIDLDDNMDNSERISCRRRHVSASFLSNTNSSFIELCNFNNKENLRLRRGYKHPLTLGRLKISNCLEPMDEAQYYNYTNNNYNTAKPRDMFFLTSTNSLSSRRNEGMAPFSAPSTVTVSENAWSKSDPKVLPLTRANLIRHTRLQERIFRYEVLSRQLCSTKANEAEHALKAQINDDNQMIVEPDRKRPKLNEQYFNPNENDKPPVLNVVENVPYCPVLTQNQPPQPNIVYGATMECMSSNKHGSFEAAQICPGCSSGYGCSLGSLHIYQQQEQQHLHSAGHTLQQHTPTEQQLLTPHHLQHSLHSCCPCTSHLKEHQCPSHLTSCENIFGKRPYCSGFHHLSSIGSNPDYLYMEGCGCDFCRHLRVSMANRHSCGRLERSHHCHSGCSFAQTPSSEMHLSGEGHLLNFQTPTHKSLFPRKGLVCCCNCIACKNGALKASAMVHSTNESNSNTTGNYPTNILLSGSSGSGECSKKEHIPIPYYCQANPNYYQFNLGEKITNHRPVLMRSTKEIPSSKVNAFAVSNWCNAQSNWPQAPVIAARDYRNMPTGNKSIVPPMANQVWVNNFPLPQTDSTLKQLIHTQITAKFRGPMNQTSHVTGKPQQQQMQQPVNAIPVALQDLIDSSEPLISGPRAVKQEVKGPPDAGCFNQDTLQRHVTSELTQAYGLTSDQINLYSKNLATDSAKFIEQPDQILLKSRPAIDEQNTTGLYVTNYNNTNNPGCQQVYKQIAYRSNGFAMGCSSSVAATTSSASRYNQNKSVELTSTEEHARIVQVAKCACSSPKSPRLMATPSATLATSLWLRELDTSQNIVCDGSF